MTTSIERIRTIQTSTATQRPVFVRQGNTPITSANGRPSSASDGVSVADASGNSAVTSALFVERGADVTAYTIQWWGYYASGAIGGKWATLGAGSLLTDLDESYSEIIPSGPVTRIYCELVAITGADGISPYIGPAEV